MVFGLVGALSLLAQEVKPGKVDVIELGKGVKLEMVLIPAGKFMMGFTKKELADLKVGFQEELKKERKKEVLKESLDVLDRIMSIQGEQHEVTLTKPFYMGKHEVTQEQWESVMGKNPSDTKGAKLPVTNVSWEDCQEFIKKLNAKTDGGYRLPTESEWEYACRAGTTTAYSFGDKITPKDANYDDSKIRKPVAVGSYKPNAFGLYDMHGNVWEWCEDWYGEYPFAMTDPKGPAKGEYRVLRGGSFDFSDSDARSSRRNSYGKPSDRTIFFGFRLARTADIKATVAEPTAPIPGSTELTPATKGLLVATFSEVKAKEAQKQLAKSLKKEVEEKEELGKDVKLEMVLIPAGKFMMGDQGQDHEVTLTKPFYMGKYEVTQEQWEAVMGDNPSSSKTKGAKLPVTDVSWNDCQDFIKKLNASTKGGYRLPTEAEWEYTCRAGTSTAYSYGDNLSMSDANTHGASIKAVGSYKPNAFGLYDMHGNVWEWCEDWYGNYPEGAVMDPKGPAKGEARVLRGGSFFDDVFLPLSSDQLGFTPTHRGSLCFGFRLARTADIKATVAEPTAPIPGSTELTPATKGLLVATFSEVKAKEAQKQLAKSLKKEVEEKEELGKDVKLEMVLIPAGKFMMGDQGQDHEVTLTKPFYMGKYEVTQEQWEAVMGDNPSSSKTKGAKLPVTDVSWNDCQDFIKKLNASTKGGYRLPTEAEWEYTCRAGTSTAYSYGDNLSMSDANTHGASIKAVGSYKPNAFGLYDMHGNVWEWCEDWKADYPAGAVTDPRTDPRGLAPAKRRVLRGGSFYVVESYARSSARNDFTPTVRGNGVGFRLARTP